MKLIVDIPDKVYDILTEYQVLPENIDLEYFVIHSTPLEEELEKVKAEIENMWIKSAKDLKTGKVIYENLCEHSEVLEIINKHISELKGDKCDNNHDCEHCDWVECPN